MRGLICLLVFATFRFNVSSCLIDWTSAPKIRVDRQYFTFVILFEFDNFLRHLSQSNLWLLLREWLSEAWQNICKATSALNGLIFAQKVVN